MMYRRLKTPMVPTWSRTEKCWGTFPVWSSRAISVSQTISCSSSVTLSGRCSPQRAIPLLPRPSVERRSTILALPDAGKDMGYDYAFEPTAEGWSPSANAAAGGGLTRRQAFKSTCIRVAVRTVASHAWAFGQRRRWARPTRGFAVRVASRSVCPGFGRFHSSSWPALSSLSADSTWSSCAATSFPPAGSSLPSSPAASSAPCRSSGFTTSSFLLCRVRPNYACMDSSRK